MKKFYTVAEFVAELAKLGIPVTERTVINWVRGRDYGIQLGRRFYIPARRLTELTSESAPA